MEVKFRENAFQPQEKHGINKSRCLPLQGFQQIVHVKNCVCKIILKLDIDSKYSK